MEVIPDERHKAAGDFTIGEFKKSGEKYVGTFRGRFTCSWPSAWDGSTQYNTCPVSNPATLTLLTPTRIEGTIIKPQPSAKLNCGKCSWSVPPTEETFAWIPELPVANE